MAVAGIEPVMRTLMRPFIGTCAETQDQLSEHLDGALPRGRERRVRRHLRSCKGCRALFDSLRRMVESVHALGLTSERAGAVSIADEVVERIRRSDL
jgi:anti-sigma factor RsiW